MKLMNKRMMRIISLVLMMVMLFTSAAFASGSNTTEEFEEGVKEGLGGLYGLMRSGAVWIAIIAVGFAGLALIMSGQNGYDKAKQTIGKVIIGIALVFLAGVIVTQISGWFDGVGADPFK